MEQPSDGTSSSAGDVAAPVRPRPGRRPGPTSTREEIARAAREEFATRGYGRSTLRAIAARAGVDPALVRYFFGSKRELFGTVMDLKCDLPTVRARLLGGDREQVGERLARFVIETLDEEGHRQRIVGGIRTAVMEAGTAPIIIEEFTSELLDPVTTDFGTGQARVRAALAMSQILGLAVGRHIVVLDALTSASRDELVSAVGPTLQRYLVDGIS